MTISRKLTAAFLVVAVIIPLVGWFTLSSTHEVRIHFGEVHRANIPSFRTISEADRSAVRMEAEIESIILRADSSTLAKYGLALQEFHHALDQYGEILLHQNSREYRLQDISMVSTLQGLRSAAQRFDSESMEIVREVESASASEELRLGVQDEWLKRMHQAYEPLRELAKRAEEQEFTEVSAHVAHIESAFATLEKRRRAAIAVGFVFALGFGWWFARRITKRIRMLSVASGKIARGAYTERVPATGYDELGALGNSLNTMVDSLLATQEMQRSVMDSIQDSILVLDAEGKIRLVNGAACKLLGVSAQGIMGRKLAELLSQSHAESQISIFDDVLLARSGRELDLSFVTASGELIPTAATVSELQTSRDSREIVLVARDQRQTLAFEELKLAHISLMEAQQKLVHSAKLAAVGALAAGVAHEINNPSSFLLVNHEFLAQYIKCARETLGTLQEQALSTFCEGDREKTMAVIAESGCIDSLAEGAEMLEENVVGLERICAITTELSHFSRIEKNAETIQLNEIVRSACKLAQHKISRTARLEVDLGTLPTIVGDSGGLSQLILNLLLNAAQAFAGHDDISKNTIWVTTRFEDDLITLCVEDTGCGISAADSEKIFEPFFTTKKRGVGTGLGLSISAETAHSHGGEIRVRSCEGEGTTITLLLPRESSKRLGDKPRETLQKEVSAATGRILVVDDDDMVRSAFRRVLTSAGHRAIEVSGAKEALELISTDSDFDVVLCDVVMPGMTGPQLYDELKKHSSKLIEVFIFVSGGALTEDSKSFSPRSGVRILWKPVSSDKLLVAVSEALRFVPSSSNSEPLGS